MKANNVQLSLSWMDPCSALHMHSMYIHTVVLYKWSLLHLTTSSSYTILSNRGLPFEVASFIRRRRRERVLITSGTNLFDKDSYCASTQRNYCNIYTRHEHRTITVLQHCAKLQWSLSIKDTLGPANLSTVERLSTLQRWKVY